MENWPHAGKYVLLVYIKFNVTVKNFKHVHETNDVRMSCCRISNFLVFMTSVSPSSTEAFSRSFKVSGAMSQDITSFALNEIE